MEPKQKTTKETKMSKTLDRIVKNDHRVKEYWTEENNGYWVVLEDGYEWCDCGQIHEDTVKEVLQQLSCVQKINNK
jgi:hypothetical protein